MTLPIFSPGKNGWVTLSGSNKPNSAICHFRRRGKFGFEVNMLKNRYLTEAERKQVFTHLRYAKKFA